MTTRLFTTAIALFFVSASLRAAVLVGNFWHNPTFEAGTDLNQSTGTPDFWNRGGSDGSILQPSSANSVSPTHSLAVIKPGAGPFGKGRERHLRSAKNQMREGILTEGNEGNEETISVRVRLLFVNRY